MANDFEDMIRQFLGGSMPPNSGWQIPGVAQAPMQSPSSAGMTTRSMGDLTSALDQARQELTAMDPKYARANDAAILDKILTDKTLFVGDSPVRRQIERLGGVARNMFGAAQFSPAPPTIPTPMSRPAAPARPAAPFNPNAINPRTGQPNYLSFGMDQSGYNSNDPRVAGQGEPLSGGNAYGHFSQQGLNERPYGDLPDSMLDPWQLDVRYNQKANDMWTWDDPNVKGQWDAARGGQNPDGSFGNAGMPSNDQEMADLISRYGGQSFDYNRPDAATGAEWGYSAPEPETPEEEKDPEEETTW